MAGYVSFEPSAPNVMNVRFPPTPAGGSRTEIGPVLVIPRCFVVERRMSGPDRSCRVDASKWTDCDAPDLGRSPCSCASPKPAVRSSSPKRQRERLTLETLRTSRAAHSLLSLCPNNLFLLNPVGTNDAVSA